MSIQYTEVFATIGANDFSATVDFYRALFAREPDEKVRDIYVAFRLPGLHLGIFDPRESDRQHFENPSYLRGGLSLVIRVPDVDRARTELESLNTARPPGPIQPTRHGREFYGYDPEGNRLIVVERSSEE